MGRAGDSEKLRVSESNLRVFWGREKQAPHFVFLFLLWPQPRRLVIAAGHNPAVIRADRHRSDPPMVAAQNDRVSRRIFCVQIPQPRRIVIAASHNPTVIRADRHRIDRSIVTAQNHGTGCRIFCAQVPEPCRVVPAAGHNPAVIRAQQSGPAPRLHSAKVSLC